VRAAPSEDNALYGRAADETRLAGAHVNAVLKLEEAFFSLCIYVIGNR